MFDAATATNADSMMNKDALRNFDRAEEFACCVVQSSTR